MKKILLLSIALTAAASVYAAPREEKNISYYNGTDPYAIERCKLDVSVPDNATDTPLVVWFHGGGLTGGGKEIPKRLRDAGYVVVAPNYRLIPRVPVDSCINDAARAVAWAFDNAVRLGSSPRKIFVAGHSAGGYLTAMIGLEKKWLAKYGVDADSIAALVPYSGQMITHFAHRDLQHIPALKATVERTSIPRTSRRTALHSHHRRPRKRTVRPLRRKPLHVAHDETHRTSLHTHLSSRRIRPRSHGRTGPPHSPRPD